MVLQVALRVFAMASRVCAGCMSLSQRKRQVALPSLQIVAVADHGRGIVSNKRLNAN